MKHSIWLPGGVNTNKALCLVQKMPSVTEFCCFSQIVLRVSFVFLSLSFRTPAAAAADCLSGRGWWSTPPWPALVSETKSHFWEVRERILDMNLIESGSSRRRLPLLLLTCSTSSRPGGEAGGWASPWPPPWKQIRSVWAGACLHKPRSSSGNRLNNDLVKNNN